MDGYWLVPGRSMFHVYLGNQLKKKIIHLSSAAAVSGFWHSMGKAVAMKLLARLLHQAG
jgi:hypothetical protein